MEVLYAILAILFLTAVIFLMVMMFKGKPIIHFPSPKPPRSNRDDYEEKTDVNEEYKLVYNGSSNMGKTIKVGTVEVKITDERNPKVLVITTIDPSINKGGVSIGRGKGNDYVMSSLMVDGDGTFLVKKIGDNYVLLANLDSANGIRETFGGERKKSIYFKNGTCTCYVGTIRFDFTDICSKAATAKTSFEGKKANFYSGTIGATQIHSM